MPYRMTARSIQVPTTPALSLAGAIWYLAEAVDAETREFEARARLQIEDEIVIVVKGGLRRAWSTDVSGPVVEVLRGQEGTAAASHAAGAEYEWLPAPA